MPKAGQAIMMNLQQALSNAQRYIQNCDYHNAKQWLNGYLHQHDGDARVYNLLGIVAHNQWGLQTANAYFQ